MRKNLLFILAVSSFSTTLFSQKVSSKPILEQGNIFAITVDVKGNFAQEAFGQAIDFTAEGTGVHSYKVTNATESNNTLHHEIKRFTFKFDAAGSKFSFDSDNKKDMDGRAGPYAKDIMSKNFDMIIDPAGKVMMVRPEKIELTKSDDRMVIVSSMLKDVMAIIYPPKKNEASFFMILPAKETGINESWTESGSDSTGKFNTTYTLTAITDSTILVDIKGSSITVVKAEMMGTPSTTTMNNSYTGKAIIDKATGILREKTLLTTSTGNTEAMGGNMPVTSKTTVTIHVKQD